MRVQLNSKDRWTRLLVVSWALVGLVLLVAGALWALGRIAPALVPFLLALIIVYLFRGPVAFLERRGMKRGLAVGLCYLGGLIALGAASVFIIPPIVDQVREFARDFPRYYDEVNTFVLDLQHQYQTLVVPDWVEEALLNVRDSVTTQFAEWSSALARQAFNVGGQAVTFLLNLLLAAVVGFWLLKDLPVMKREVTLLAGPGRREEALDVATRVDRVLSGYLRGQLIISTSTAAIVAIGLGILGVPYALVLGLIAGILNVVPYVGPFISYVIAAIVAAFVSPWLALGAVAVNVGAQQVTDMLITPRVMSEQVDLHPVLVIFSLLAGATLFGFIGLILAIPVAAVVKGLFVYYFEKYTDSTLSSEEGALFRSRADEDAPPAEDEPAEKTEKETE